MLAAGGSARLRLRPRPKAGPDPVQRSGERLPGESHEPLPGLCANRFQPDAASNRSGVCGMARAARRALRLRLHQDRQGNPRCGAGEHRRIYVSHFGMVRKAAGSFHVFGPDPAGPGRVARGNRRGDDGDKRRVHAGTGR